MEIKKNVTTTQEVSITYEEIEQLIRDKYPELKDFRVENVVTSASASPKHLKFRFVTSETVGEKVSKADALAFLDLPIEEMGLGVRASNALLSMGAKKAKDVLKKTESQLLEYRNIGKTIIEEIRKVLQSKGLDFKKEP